MPYLEENMREPVSLETHQFLDERVVRADVYVIHSRDFVVLAREPLRVQVWGQGEGWGDIISSRLANDSYAGIEILDGVVNEISELKNHTGE